MAVVFRSASTGSGVGTNLTVTEPAGAASGDVLISIACRDSASQAAPTGWTSLYSGTQGTLNWQVAWIARGASAPSLTWAGTNHWREVQLLCLRSDTGGSITLDSQSAAGTSGTGTNPNPPSTTAVASASLAVCGGANVNGSAAGGYGAPTGYTRRDTGADGDVSTLATKTLSSSGAEDPAAFSNASGSASFWNGFTLTFTDGGGGGATVTYPQLERGLRGVARGVYR